MKLKLKKQLQEEAETRKVAPVLFEVAPTLPPEEPDDEEILNYKVSDIQFWAVLRESYGVYAKAARLLKQAYDIDISRQAIHSRATRHPDKLEDCRAYILDDAEQVLVSLLRSKDDKVRLGAAKHITDKRGSSAGWVAKQQTEHSGTVQIQSVTVEHVVVDTPFASSEKEITE